VKTYAGSVTAVGRVRDLREPTGFAAKNPQRKVAIAGKKYELTRLFPIIMLRQERNVDTELL
jgi:hypothetical protein